jgi:putative transposase
MAMTERIQHAGGFYHVTVRGARQLPIYFDDRDRGVFTVLLEAVIRRFEWKCHVWCLMTNHFHLVIELSRINMSKGMHSLNYAHSRWLNRRHGYSGHAFDQRFNAVEVETTAHLLELSRYVVLNPVRAGACKAPQDYRWSSYRELVGLDRARFSETGWLLEQFGRTRDRAIENYKQFVADGLEALAPFAPEL